MQLAAELAAEPELQELVLVVEPGLQAQAEVQVEVQQVLVEVQAAELLGLPAVERVVEQEQLAEVLAVAPELLVEALGLELALAMAVLLYT